jgi:NAD(P)-dependent dehydrogenase (short-subunit alcohol dehydrogenase family)
MARPPVARALVTGASRGIGRAVASALAPDHALILVARDAGDLERAAAELRTRGPHSVITHVCDLGRAEARAELAAQIGAWGVHVLVNNAGIGHSAPLERIDDATWARLMAINLTAPFELCRAALPWMVAAGFGRIVNVASTAALKGYRYTAAYSATKAGLVGLTRAVALDVATKGVTVNAVCPGFTDTAIAADAIENIARRTGQTPEQARAALEAFNPQRRLVDPVEVGALVAYLVGPAADGITGQALAVDGGETA